MKISPEGKQFIEQVLAQAEGATLRFYGVAGCCGMNLSAEIAQAQEADKVELLEVCICEESCKKEVYVG